MYESPIRLLVQEIETHMREQHDNQIFEAIQKFGVDVDRDELIKALAYDRGQYDKGYADGRADAQRWTSAKDRLPEKFEDVLVRVNVGDASWYEVAHWRADHWSVPCITHWMPIPRISALKAMDTPGAWWNTPNR